MGCYFDKADLYREIAKIKNLLNLGPELYTLDFIEKCCLISGLKIVIVPFKTEGLRGMAAIGDLDSDDDVIILNGNRSLEEQKFSCGHELIHLILHRNEKTKNFQCYDKIRSGQNSILEWHANEGAAELFVPYKKFIPRYVQLSRNEAHKPFGGSVIKILALEFSVTEGVISNRINSLNYEIDCYLKGQDLNDIPLMSKRALQRIGWKQDHRKRYCMNCLSPIQVSDTYCMICGHTLIGTGAFKDIRYKGEGAGYMIYPGVQTGSDGKATNCPCCGNEEIMPDGRFCMVCGSELINHCDILETIDEGGQNIRLNPCDKGALLPGNARFCPYCGNPTSFCYSGYLSKWDANK